MACPKPGPSRRGLKQPIPDSCQSFHIELLLVVPTDSRLEVIDDALRLLAVWAVRAARSSIAKPTSSQQAGSPDDPHDPTEEENQ